MCSLEKAYNQHPLLWRGAAILLVEEIASLRVCIGHMGSEQGFEIIVAHDTASALNLWERHHSKIDLLLIDAEFREFAGAQLAVFLLDLKPELKVVIWSEKYSEVIRVLKHTNPGVYFLRKPFSEQDLEWMLASSFGGE